MTDEHMQMSKYNGYKTYTTEYNAIRRKVGSNNEESIAHKYTVCLEV